MAKKVGQSEQVRRTKIMSMCYAGYIDEMPEEAKVRLKIEKPEVYNRIFGEQTPQVETQAE